MRSKQSAEPLACDEATGPRVSRRTFVACGALSGALGLLGCSNRPDESSPGHSGWASARPLRSAGSGPGDGPEAADTAPVPHDAPPQREATDASSEASGALPVELNAWLTACAVLGQRPHATTLRTWTTSAQARELERGQVLTRSHGADLSRSFFDQLMDRRSSNDPVARLLTSDPWRRSRYAWPRAWPTSRGLHGSHYGPVLATLQLRSDALWLAYTTASPDTWTLHDASGPTLPGVDPREVASRIVGVFFEATPLATQPYRARNTVLPGWGAWGMREYIVRNPAMIERTTVDDSAERARHREDLARLTQLGVAGAGEELPADFGVVAARIWETPPREGESWPLRFARALAIATPTYAPTSSALAALAAPLAPQPTRRPSSARARPQPTPRQRDWDIS